MNITNKAIQAAKTLPFEKGKANSILEKYFVQEIKKREIAHNEYNYLKYLENRICDFCILWTKFDKNL